MANLETLELKISANAQEATKGLGNLISSLQSLQSIVPKVTTEMQRLNQQLQILNSLGINPKIFNNMKSAQTAGNMAGQSAAQYGMKLLNTASTQELMNKKLEETGRQYLVNAYQGKLNNKQLIDGAIAYKNLQSKVEKLNNAVEETGEATKNGGGLAALKQGLKNLTSGVTGLMSRIKRIATTMLIRKAIRSLVAYTKEGITNLYGWSKSINGSFASAMDTAKTKVATLKNSLGAMLGPVISALIPLFNSLTSAVISAANWINQFISLLSGKTTWTKAIEKGTEDVEELGKEASGTGSAVKDMIASFDELNVITSSSGSSSGIGAEASEEYEGLFEDIDTFDSKIRELSDFVKTNLETIKTLAVGVGTALLAWKIGTAFVDLLPTLSTIFGYVATGATIAITLGLTWMLENQYLQTGDTGYLWTSVLTNAVGATAAAAIAKKLIGGQAGYYAASITLSLSALVGITALLKESNVDALSEESLKTSVVNALKMGAAGTLLFVAKGATIGKALAGGAAVALATFGIVIGLKATMDVIDTGEITADTLKADVISALAMGSAGAVLAVMGGAGVGTALAGGALLAIATFAVLATAQAVISLASSPSQIKWGNFHATEQQVDDYVRSSMFKVDPLYAIELTKDNITKISTDSTAIGEKISEMIGTLRIIELGLAEEGDYKTIKEQITGEGGLIDKVSEFINDAKNTSKLALTLYPQLIGTDTESQNAWYLENMEGWSTVEKHMQGIGEELANLIVEGEDGQLEVKRPERVATLLEEANKIAQILAGKDISTEAYIDFKFTLKDLDESGFNTAMQKYSEYKTKAKEAAVELQKQLISNQERLVESLKEMFEVDPNNAELKKQLEDAEAGLSALWNEYEEKVNAAADEFAAPGREVLQEWIDNNMGLGSVNITWTDEYLKEWLNTDGFEETLREIFVEAGLNMDNIDVTEFLSLGGWDTLNEDLQKKILENVTLDSDTIATLKNSINMSAEDIINISGWQDMSQNQQVEFLKALTDAYGSEEAIKKAKEAGMNVADLVEAGMKSGNPDIKKAAEGWDAEVKKGFDDKTHKTAVDVAKDAKFNEHKDKIASDVEDKKIQMKAALAKNASFDTNKDKFAKEVSDKKSNMQVSVAKIAGEKGFDKTLKTYVDTVNAKSGYVKVGATKKTGSDGFDTALGKITAMINKKTGTVKAFVTLADGQKVALETQLASLGVDMKVSAQISNMASLVLTLKTKIKETFGTLFTKMGWKWEAEGGIVNSGDIFVANENGKSEMIGRFGNHTGVANQEQMVEAMARGVSYAQSAQNSLLREQNALLRAILAKEGNVTIGASSALGRTVKQSLNMYNSMTGG